jgi:hypothetical protein
MVRTKTGLAPLKTAILVDVDPGLMARMRSSSMFFVLKVGLLRDECRQSDAE